MKTLFGIRSNVAIAVVGSLYVIVSLHTSIYEIKFFKKFQSEEHKPRGYLLINTDTELFHIISLALSVSCLLSAILLVLGVVEKRYSILKPWLIVNFVLEAILTSGIFYLIFLLIQLYQSSWKNVCGLLLAIFINAITMAFHDYLRNGTHALYIKFQKDSRRLYRVFDSEDNAGIHTV